MNRVAKLQLRAQLRRIRNLYGAQLTSAQRNEIDLFERKLNREAVETSDIASLNGIEDLHKSKTLPKRK